MRWFVLTTWMCAAICTLGSVDAIGRRMDLRDVVDQAILSLHGRSSNHNYGRDWRYPDMFRDREERLDEYFSPVYLGRIFNTAFRELKDQMQRDRRSDEYIDKVKQNLQDYLRETSPYNREYWRNMAALYGEPFNRNA